MCDVLCGFANLTVPHRLMHLPYGSSVLGELNTFQHLTLPIIPLVFATEDSSTHGITTRGPTLSSPPVFCGLWYPNGCSCRELTVDFSCLGFRDFSGSDFDALHLTPCVTSTARYFNGWYICSRVPRFCLPTDRQLPL